MKRRLLTILMACLLSPVLCAQEAPMIPFEILDNGSISGAKQDTTAVVLIQNQGDWETFWNQHITVVPKSAPPAVNFDEKTVIAVVDSDQPNSGYYVRLDRIENHDGEYWVYVTREQPGTSCMNLGMIAQPFVIVTTDKLEGTTKLVLNTSMYDC